jgi:hypothetical protein
MMGLVPMCLPDAEVSNVVRRRQGDSEIRTDRKRKHSDPPSCTMFLLDSGLYIDSADLDVEIKYALQNPKVRTICCRSTQTDVNGIRLKSPTPTVLAVSRTPKYFHSPKPRKIQNINPNSPSQQLTKNPHSAPSRICRPV